MEFIALTTQEGKQTTIEFPDAPGCQTFADEYEDPHAVAREALEGWLEVHLEEGDVPPRPSAELEVAAGQEQLRVRVAPQLAVRLQIRWAREDQQLSQGQLAKRIGVTRQAIQQLERPDANLRLTTLEKVARALGLELDIALVPAHA